MMPPRHEPVAAKPLTMTEGDFPALPRAKTCPPERQVSLNTTTSRSTNSRKTSAPTVTTQTHRGSLQKTMTQVYRAANPCEAAGIAFSSPHPSKNAEAYPAVSAQQPYQTPACTNLWCRPLQPWTPPNDDHPLYGSIGDDSYDDESELAEQQALLDREILDTSESGSDWEKRRCSCGYEGNMQDYARNEGQHE